MPIAYACPHCGKQFSVADQYAGQTGPCAGCGKSITIPLAAGMPVASAGPAPASGCGGTAVIITVLGVLLIGGVCILGILAALLLPAVQAARGAARRAQSMNNVKQILLAVHNYHDAFGALPPVVVSDANGQPLYSGRVLLLPFLEQAALYEQFDKTQSWDSPQNLPLSQTVLKVFSDPAAANLPAGQTDYLFVTGSQTAFEAGKTVRFADVLDGTANTMVVVEIKGSGINWAEPKDLDINQPMSLPAGNHPGGNIVGMTDGSVRWIQRGFPQLLRR